MELRGIDTGGNLIDAFAGEAALASQYELMDRVLVGGRHDDIDVIEGGEKRAVEPTPKRRGDRVSRNIQWVFHSRKPEAETLPIPRGDGEQGLGRLEKGRP